MIIRNRFFVALVTAAAWCVPLVLLRRFSPPQVVADDGHTADLW